MTSYILLTASELHYIFDTTIAMKVIKLLVITIFLFKVCFVDKYTFKKIAAYLLIILGAFINSLYIDSNEVFFTILVLLSTANIDFRKFVKIDLAIRIILVTLIVASCLIGLLPNFAKLVNGSFKQALGFTHPNVLCFFIITILLELMYLKRKITAKYIAINVLALVFMYLICYSRTAVCVYAAIFILDILIRNKEKIFNKRIVKIFIMLLPIILTVLSFVAIIEYGHGSVIMKKINQVSTTRISNGYKYYSNYGVSLFGSKISTVGTRKSLLTGEDISILDMGYLKLAIANGVLITVAFLLILYFQLKNVANRKEYELLIICIFFIISGLSETNIYNIAMNFSLVAILPLAKSFQTKNKVRINE